MTTARSKGVGGIYATQAMSNVMAVYGRDDARAIFGVPNLFIACKNDDADTKQFVSDRAGQQYVEVESKTESDGGERDSTTRREEKRPMLEPHALSELRRPKKKHWRPLAEAYVLRNGENFKVEFDRSPFGVARVIRGVIAKRVDDREWNPRSVLWLAFQVVAALAVLAVPVALALLAVSNGKVATGWSKQVLAQFSRSSPSPAWDQRPADNAVGVHIVQRGETLGRIAQRYGIHDPTWLAAANDLPSMDRLEVGQRLRIPTNLRIRAFPTSVRLPLPTDQKPKTSRPRPH